MGIALIGMSGIGKTFWSQKLKEYGFMYYGCDDRIEEKLGSELSNDHLYGLEGVSHWMGQPYDSKYSIRSNYYVALEEECMNDIYLEIRKNGVRNFVIDTTGSIIYTSEQIRVSLADHALVVYLKESASHMNDMFNQYLKDPRPVIWGNSYTIQPGETKIDALRRCYPRLLSFRQKQYEEYADVVLPFEQHHHQHVPFTDFIECITRKAYYSYADTQ